MQSYVCTLYLSVSKQTTREIKTDTQTKNRATQRAGGEVGGGVRCVNTNKQRSNESEAEKSRRVKMKN